MASELDQTHSKLAVQLHDSTQSQLPAFKLKNIKEKQKISEQE